MGGYFDFLNEKKVFNLDGGNYSWEVHLFNNERVEVLLRTAWFLRIHKCQYRLQKLLTDSQTLVVALPPELWGTAEQVASIAQICFR